MPRARQSGSKSKAEPTRQKKQLHPSKPIAESSSQQTISELFTTSKQGLKELGADELPVSSPSKRQKTNHISAQTVDQIRPRTIGSGEMYNFSPAKPKSTTEIIDLTGAEIPNGSTEKKKQAVTVVRPTNFNARNGPKRLVVKNLKDVSRPDPDAYFNRVWTQLEASLTALFSGNPLPYSMEELYKGVEFSCRQDRGPSLFTRLQASCERGVSVNIKEPLLRRIGSNTDIDALHLVVAAWSRWTTQLKKIHSIFYYLDRSYLLNSTQSPSIQEMGTNQFRDLVYSDPSTKPRILQGACDMIGVERNGKQSPTDKKVLQDAIKMSHSLSIYSKDLEPRLLSESEQYFSDWVGQTINSNDIPGYVKMSQNLIADELSRAERLGLEQTTRKSLEKYLEDILIDQRQNRLVKEADVIEILTNGSEGVLEQLFTLLQRRDLGEKLRQPWEAYINKQGSEIVFDEEHEQTMVPRLLDFKRKLDSILERCFQKHEGLGHSLRDAFEKFINKSKRSNMTWGTDNPKPGEMIAKHVDAILKGGAKAVRSSGVGLGESLKAGDDDEARESEDEDVEITRSLDQVLDLFRFVHGKAVFEAFYKRDLARRLLLGRSASSDAEKSMLTRLKSGKMQVRYIRCIVLC